jgi:hypothetical protein
VSAPALVEAGFTPYEVYRAGFPANEISFALGTRLAANVDGRLLGVGVDAASQCRNGQVLLFRGNYRVISTGYGERKNAFSYHRVPLSAVVVLPDLWVCSANLDGSAVFPKVVQEGYRPEDEA